MIVLTSYADKSDALQSAQSNVVEHKEARENVSKRFSELQTEKTTIDASFREERLKSENLQTENESLKVSLQAKKEREAEAARLAAIPAQAPAPAQKQVAATVAVSGSKADWLAASGIPASHWGLVDAIVSRESGWNPNAVNASSGACGLGQQLPCGKWAGAWNDPVAALQGMNSYVNGRYGGWPQANAFWNANHWY